MTRCGTLKQGTLLSPPTHLCPIGQTQSEDNWQGISNNAIHRIKRSKTPVFVVVCYFLHSILHSVL